MNSAPIPDSIPEPRAVGAPGSRRKLGKGLGALLGETRREEPLAAPPGAHSGGEAGDPSLPAILGITSGLANLPVGAIEPHPDQPRRHFDEEALAELAASIAARGVIQPVIVRPVGPGRYQLVAGERRWRAAQRAQLHEIPALVRELSERDVLALALIENIQREDLNPVEEARAYRRLSELEAMTQIEIARVVEKSRSHVANLLRLLTLPETVLDHLEAGRLDMGHGRALIGLESAAEIAESAVARKLSVRAVEKLARQARAGTEPGRARSFARSPRDPVQDADIAAVQGHLEDFLGLPVKILTEADSTTGTLTVRFRNLDQLDLICQRLTGGQI